MNFFEKIIERFQNKETTLSGIASMALPIILGVFGVSHPHILLVNAGFGVLTAWLAKKDTSSAAGLTGSFGAMALQTFGIPVPDFVISLLNGFTGFFSRDQKSPLPARAFLVLFFLGISAANLQAQSAALPSDRIPCEFQVFGTNISVVMDSAYCEIHGAYGVYNHREARIRINNAEKPHISRLSETFYHELTHCLFESIGRNDLSSDEMFVGIFSRVLRQALTSFRYNCHTQ